MRWTASPYARSARSKRCSRSYDAASPTQAPASFGCFSTALRKLFSARPKLLARKYFLPRCTSSLGSSPTRPGCDSGATGSPLGPGSAGCVSTEPVVSSPVLSFLDGNRSLSRPVTPPSFGAVLDVSSLNFGAVEQALRLIRHAAPTIRIRATRILITRSGPQPPGFPAPRADGPSRPQAGQHRTSQARRRWLRKSSRPGLPRSCPCRAGQWRSPSAGHHAHDDRAQDDHEQHREDADHHRNGELGGQAVGLLLGPRQSLVAHVVAVDAQRIADAGAELVGLLDQGGE